MRFQSSCSRQPSSLLAHLHSDCDHCPVGLTPRQGMSQSLALTPATAYIPEEASQHSCFVVAPHQIPAAPHLLSSHEMHTDTATSLSAAASAVRATACPRSRHLPPSPSESCSRKLLELACMATSSSEATSSSSALADRSSPSRPAFSRLRLRRRFRCFCASAAVRALHQAETGFSRLWNSTGC